MPVLQEWTIKLDDRDHIIQLETFGFTGMSLRIRVNGDVVPYRTWPIVNIIKFKIGEHKCAVSQKSISMSSGYKLTIDGELQVSDEEPAPKVQISILERLFWVVVAAVSVMITMGVAVAFEIRPLALVPASLAFYAINKASRGSLF